MKFFILAVLFVISADGQGIRGRIFNGQEAVRGQFKYAAAVYTRNSYDSNEGGMCAGAIIAPNWVLTAAHCVYRKVEAAVLLGSVDRSQPQVEYMVTQLAFMWHSQYNPHTFWNDIALIEIPKTLQCGNIAYARLPQPATEVHMGDNAIIMGWGRIGNGSDYPDRLRFGKVQIITNEECRKVFHDVIDEEICANTEGPHGSTCKGDSGGPMVLRNTGEVIGIASSMADECTKGKPTVFVRVTKYLNWLTTATGEYF